MSFLDLAMIAGVRRDVVGRWYAMWQDGGMETVKVGERGTPKGSGLRLPCFEQERFRKCLIEEVSGINSRCLVLFELGTPSGWSFKKFTGITSRSEQSAITLEG